MKLSHNLSIEFRWAGGHYDRLPSLAVELVARNLSVIVAVDVPSSFAAKAATRTIPIVFVTGVDPVKLSLVDSFNQPRGNVTGMSILFWVLWGLNNWNCYTNCSRIPARSSCF
jgi:putative tryptophan/tyrosine transport system substrate-binding protein